MFGRLDINALRYPEEATEFLNTALRLLGFLELCLLKSCHLKEETGNSPFCFLLCRG